MTNYQFDVRPDALRGALERFSHFFISPLCKADALDREVNAVHNEFLGGRRALLVDGVKGKEESTWKVQVVHVHVELLGEHRGCCDARTSALVATHGLLQGIAFAGQLLQT